VNIPITQKRLPSGSTLHIIQGDIAIEEVDAIVNAANEHLQHNGGLAWTIVRRGGDVIQQESAAWVRAHGPVSHSAPAWTSGGNLPAKYVIHAVGPVWGEGQEDAKLAAAVQGSLGMADELGIQTIAMPAISTGIFGFPKERAAGIILAAIDNHFAKKPASGVRQVRIVLFDQPTVDAFLKAWQERWTE
jgi:putative ATPase